MTTLKLFLENDGKSWTLRPNREYIIGSGSDCQISLPEAEIANQQLKFNFNPQSNLWYAYNLDESAVTYINNQRVYLLTKYPITNQSRISVGKNLNFVAIPEGSRPPVTPQPELSTIYPSPNSSSTYGKSFTHQQVNDAGLRDLAIVRYINRAFFDKEDPEKLRGTCLGNFSFSFSYPLGLKHQPKLELIREDLYKNVYERLIEYQRRDPYLNAYLTFKVIHYIDYQYYDDRARIYIEIVRDTIRKTKITTLLRFFVNGDNLYLAADSYALGKLKKRKLIFHSIFLIIIVTMAINPLVWFVPVSLLFIPIFLVLWYLYATWIKFIQALSQRESFITALRVNFPKNIRDNAFDLDDIFMFLKIVYPLMISSLEEVLREHGLLDEDLTTVLKDIRKNIGQTNININTGGGGIFGSMFGGSNNSIKNL